MTKEKAIEIATKYISDRKRTCDRIIEDPVHFESNKEISYGKYKETLRDAWTVSYEVDWIDGPMDFFVVVDDKTEEVLYTITPSGYAEDWEEDITEL
jgi:hypothetical protein